MNPEQLKQLDQLSDLLGMVTSMAGALKRIAAAYDLPADASPDRIAAKVEADAKPAAVRGTTPTEAIEKPSPAYMFTEAGVSIAMDEQKEPRQPNTHWTCPKCNSSNYVWSLQHSGVQWCHRRGCNVSAVLQ